MISDQEATKRLAKRQGKTVVTDFILIDKDDKKPHEVVRILDNDPVRKLLNRGTITREQFEAAERLYSDWYIGGMSPRVVKPPKFVQVDEGSPEFGESDTRLFCIDRCFKAMQYLRAKQLQCVIEEIVLHCRSIGDVAKQFVNQSNANRANGACVELLKVGLDILIDFYDTA